MKLYTEEQVDIMLSRARLQKQDDTYMFTNEYLLSQETPIEVPSDEEIEQYATFAFPDAEKIGGETYTAYRGMKNGAKWMKSKILGNNHLGGITY